MKYYVVTDSADPTRLAVIGAEGFIPDGSLGEAPMDGESVPDGKDLALLVNEDGTESFVIDTASKELRVLDDQQASDHTVYIKEVVASISLDSVIKALILNDTAMLDKIRLSLSYKEYLEGEKAALEEESMRYLVVNVEGIPKIVKYLTNVRPANLVCAAPYGFKDGVNDEQYLTLNEDGSCSIDIDAKMAAFAAGPSVAWNENSVLGRIKEEFLG